MRRLDVTTGYSNDERAREEVAGEKKASSLQLDIRIKSMEYQYSVVVVIIVFYEFDHAQVKPVSTRERIRLCNSRLVPPSA